MSKFSKEFKERGYLYQSTDDLESIDKIVAYIGFDCTAKSLHVGNMMQLMILRLLQQSGHKPIVLIGGATTKIGDPSFRDEARSLLDEKTILSNIDGIKKSISKFIKFGDGLSDAILVNNNDWLGKVGYIEFLRDFGKHFSVNKMLSMDSVKTRLERGLSFLEFNYMLMQAYDFWFLNQNYGCNMQIGGSDQWGNIIHGVELCRRMSGSTVYGITTPLITTASGAKMGKTLNGAVWINEDMFSPYDYFQYWRNIADADVLKFAKMFGEFSKDEFSAFEHIRNINEAKKILAHKLTTICHGKTEADKALDASLKIFEEKSLSENMPTFEVIKNTTLIDAMQKFGLSKSESRKLIRSNAVKIDGNTIDNELMNLQESEVKVSIGKKKHFLLKIQ